MVREAGVEPARPYGHRILSPARLPVPPLPLKRVPEAGVEPARPYGHRILSPARLPVPPLRLWGEVPSLGSRFKAINSLGNPFKGLRDKWPRAESNRRHPGFQPGALPPELPGLYPREPKSLTDLTVKRNITQKRKRVKTFLKGNPCHPFLKRLPQRIYLYAKF